MAQPSARETADPFVEAALAYSVDTGVKPVSVPVGPSGQVEQRAGRIEEHVMPIRDGRRHAGGFSLERDGFALIRHETRVSDFYDADEVRGVYYPEIEALVKAETGASRVLIFDHTVRCADEATQDAKGVREPVKTVHNDYTEWSGPQRVRDLLPADEAARLLQNRVAVIQVWRPIGAPVEQLPLAICDAESLAPEDLIPAERHHPDRVGEIYHVAYSPAHRWYYFPRMRRDEALIFKCYDSETDGRARFTAHGSFEDPTTPRDAPPRESIEMRTLAFFDPADG